MGSKPKVVIIGSGFGGLWAANALANKPVGLTSSIGKIITPFSRFFIRLQQRFCRPARSRRRSAGSFTIKRTSRSFWVRWSVFDAKEKAVLLENGQRIGFDYLIVQPGPATHILERSVGNLGSGTKDGRRCRRDAATYSSRVRGGRTRSVPERQRASPEFCGSRRRADRR